MAEKRTVDLVLKMRADGVSYREIEAQLKQQRRFNRVGRPITLRQLVRIVKGK